MQLFFADNLDSDFYTLSEEESKHCIKVLRMRQDDLLHLTDGRGLMATARITDPDPRHCQVMIETRQYDYQRREKRLIVAVAPTKNTARIEWFIEKAVELGIDGIVPIVCDHSERVVIRQERLDKIVVTAMKQSLKAFKPEVKSPISLKQYLTSDEVQHFDGLKLIAHCEGDQRNPINQVLMPGKDVIMLIGPEGDFSPQEIQLALQQGFIPVTLGNCRLRTETAALYAVVASSFVD